MRVRRLGLGVALCVAIILGSGCGELEVPKAMEPSSPPSFEVASRNAAVHFFGHLQRQGGRILSQQKAFSYALEVFDDAVKQQVLDREAFALMYCDSAYVEKENTIRQLLALRKSWPEEYATVHQKMQEVSFNLFIRWLGAGDMKRTGKPEEGKVQSSGYQKVVNGDEDAYRNAARRILWMAGRSGIFPVQGRLDVEIIARRIQESAAEPAFAKIMKLENLRQCFRDQAYLDYLVLDERMSQLVSQAPSEAFIKASKTCVEQISRVFAALEQGLLKRGYVELPETPKGK